MERFEDYFAHEESAIRTAATLLHETRIALERAEITHDEFIELTTDILQIQEIDDITDNLDRKVMFEQAIAGLKLATSAISLIDM